MQRYRLNYRFMGNNGEMIDYPFVGWEGDTTVKSKFTPKFAVTGYTGQIPTFSESEAAEAERLLDFMCDRASVADDRSGPAYARQFVRVPV